MIGENDLKSQYPDLALEFDSAKNNILPEEILYTNTDDSIWWLCKEGHSFQRSVWYRVNNVRECPICNRTIVVKGINDFESTYPDITGIWDYEVNERTPDSISDKNNDKYAFKCQKGHHYETFLRSAIYNEFQCLVCNFKLIKPGINSLVDTDEELAKEWSLNDARKPYEFHKYSKYNALWECPTCHGEYSYSVRDRYVGDDSCPYCNNRKVLIGVNSLADIDEELAKEWSNNNEKGPTEYLRTSSYTALWTCPTCQGDYPYTIRDREAGDNSCPYCNNRKVLIGVNSLADVDEELAKEWSSSNEKGPTEYLRTSSYIVLWTCPTCQGDYPYAIREREVGDNSCPYCNNRKALAGYNTLETVLDDIDLIWSNSNDKDYTELLPTSSYDAEWKCGVCNGLYKEAVYSFVPKHLNAEDDCPYCKNKKPLPGFNTLKVKCEDLMSEWNYRSNYLIVNPDEILPTYPEEVWWTCKCGKNYKMSPKKRLYYQKRHMKSCPYCKGRRRKKYRHF